MTNNNPILGFLQQQEGFIEDLAGARRGAGEATDRGADTVTESRFSEATRSEACRDYMRSESGLKVAKKYGVSTPTIYGWLDDAGITRRTKFQDLTGKKFNRLLVLKGIRPTVKRGLWKWVCRCDCGSTSVVRSYDLTSGGIKSCGCARRETLTTHGAYNTPVYKVWNAMKQRCRNPNNESYKDYGGRGITVCDRWADNFAAFVDDMGECPPGHSLDRVDNDGPYEPWNCRWATPKQQVRNRRITRRASLNGEVFAVAELAKRYGLVYETVLRNLPTSVDVPDARATLIRFGAKL